MRDSLKFLTRPISRHIALAVTIMLGSQLLFALSVDKACGLAQSWMSGLPAIEGTQCAARQAEPDADSTSWAKPPYTSDPIERLNQLGDVAYAQARHHVAVAQFFYSRYYAAAHLTLALAVAAGVCLIFVSKKGWSTANPYLLNVFVTLSALGVYYGAFPGVFDQKSNMESNRDQYVKYINVEQDIRTFLAHLNSSEPQQLQDFLLTAQKRLVEINNISVGIDHTKVSDLPSILPEP